ncbi:MAG: class SAM-dependent methyltransferase [Flaviaesturariibacter sp.]|nr:class SAM-dependent methyltransferase [Flaviaesturariibacter sp.]
MSADTHTSFAASYIALREREGRLYSDEELACLPTVRPGHPLLREWATRGASAERLCRYLRRKRRSLRILEIGCGNGWLSNKLAQVPGAIVTGTDINELELTQAQRVFHRPNLSFSAGGLDRLHVSEGFDIVVFAASFQYFQEPSRTLGEALSRLCDAGEVHIIDSHFYSPASARTAAARSRSNFEEKGFPALAGSYHHHTWDSLGSFRPAVLNRLSLFAKRLQKNGCPFPWVRITKPANE